MSHQEMTIAYITIINISVKTQSPKCHLSIQISTVDLPHSISQDETEVCEDLNLVPFLHVKHQTDNRCILNNTSLVILNTAYLSFPFLLDENCYL
jgi:hypothetical protein